jgi:hypothetical protein
MLDEAGCSRPRFIILLSCHGGVLAFSDIIITMNKTSLVQYIVRAEYAIAAALVAVFYVSVGNFDWYWLPILFMCLILVWLAICLIQKLAQLSITWVTV